VTKIIAVTNQKGGVGKTTTAITIAHGLSQHGKNVLLVDFDPQGQCATALGVNPEPCVFNLLITNQSPALWVRESGRLNLRLIPSDRTTATAQAVINAEGRSFSAVLEAVKPLMREYDFLVFDTAPSAGGLQERAIWASDLVLIPSATEFLSSDGLTQIMSTLTQLRETRNWKGKLLGVLPTFYDEQTRESRSSLEELQKTFGKALLAPIHRATILRECAAEGITVFEKDANSRASKEYQKIVNILLKRA
jgi:chromosome partitioning protein